MRWRPKPKPKDGDERTLEVYAWTPTMLDDGTMVWLERFRLTQKFRTYNDRNGACVRDRWVDTKRVPYHGE